MLTNRRHVDFHRLPFPAVTMAPLQTRPALSVILATGTTLTRTPLASLTAAASSLAASAIRSALARERFGAGVDPPLLADIRASQNNLAE